MHAFNPSRSRRGGRGCGVVLQLHRAPQDCGLVLLFPAFLCLPLWKALNCLFFLSMSWSLTFLFPALSSILSFSSRSFEFPLLCPTPGLHSVILILILLHQLPQRQSSYSEISLYILDTSVFFVFVFTFCKHVVYNYFLPVCS